MKIPGLSLFPRPDETIEGVARLIRSGERTCVEVVEACLSRIDESEPEIKAWVVVDREGALAQARERDAELAEGKDGGPLHGIPIGVKDIIDVEGFPTAGAPYGDAIAPRDALVVGRLREIGVVILGKTVTTPHAWIDPPPTRNPWDLERTPGGSSSGSAAALAAGMCLGALGTQTGGSITRPAAFCGLASVKPSFRSINVRGIMPLAPSLDTPGAMARTVGDLALLWQGMGGRDDPSALAPRWNDPSYKPRFHRLRGFFDEHADEAMRKAIESVTGELLEAGAQVFEIERVQWSRSELPSGPSLPRSSGGMPSSTLGGDRTDAERGNEEDFGIKGLARFEEIRRCHRTIMAAEAAAVHRARREVDPGDYPKQISALIDEGLPITAVDYLDARKHQNELRHWQQQLLRRPDGSFSDALIVPAAIGPAPGRSSTGDPIFNSPWTFSGQPTISLPIGLSSDGLPLAIQLVGLHGADYSLFQAARWCEKVLRDRTPRD
jgi:aspartyl-tRNA(Asn)/glutamyl-tRNA(Gln) amidotransferase subunit A